MATDAVGEERRTPPEPENLLCPRCDSANTKFCYYNNYNLSQPRYFCKSCRRYWTRGGTLRNIPVGGGTRKNSKRSRSSSSSTVASIVTQPPKPPLPVDTSPFENQKVGKTEVIISKWQDDLELNMNEGSFTSLLTTANASDYGLGLALGLRYETGSSGYDDIGFGLGASITMGNENQQIVVGQNGGKNNTWQFGGGESMDGAGCFGWPDLAI